jgi:hypothetical protein
MPKVVLRDDDTNAFTPVEFLERLYGPFRDRGMPVHLAVIPHVSTAARRPDGEPEAFLLGNHDRGNPYSGNPRNVPIDDNASLCRYLISRGYDFLHHGLHHDTIDGVFEFALPDRKEIARRLDLGRERLLAAGLGIPPGFVAPYDALSPAAHLEVAARFPAISTGWYEWKKLPLRWMPRYAMKKLRREPHWRVGDTLLLSHPGCLLSRYRNYDGMLEAVRRAVESQPLTVLVTHWWEYFPQGQPDEAFIAVLHEVASWLASRRDIEVVRLGEVTRGTKSLHRSIA